MGAKSRRSRSSSDEATNISPARRRSANELLGRMAALDRVGDGPIVDGERERLRAQASKMGFNLVALTITQEPIPDPALDALPRTDFMRIRAITHDMYTRPARHVAELEALVAKYPHIPVIRNHLAGALEAAGHRDRASQVIAEAARQFPNYMFAFCNHVMMLLSDRKVDEARRLVETGPRGPLLTLRAFDPTRETFHISEAIAFSAMVGHYLLYTGRTDAASVQLKMLRELAPDSAQYRSLAAAIKAFEGPLGMLAQAVGRLREDLQKKEERRKARQQRQAAADTADPLRVKIRKLAIDKKPRPPKAPMPAPDSDRDLFGG